MKARSGPIAWLIYVVVRAIFAIMQAFPIEWNLQTARMIARVWKWVMPKHHHRAVAHLSAAFGDEKSPAEIQRLAERSLASVAMFAVEVVCLPRLINGFAWRRYIRLVNFNEALEVCMSQRGAILVTGHYGSFELIGHLLAALGFNLVSVMRPLDNVYLNDFLVRTRQTHGLTLLDKKGAIQSAEQVLEDGALLGFIGDQDAGRKGVFVDFFGQSASTYKSIGLLAMSIGVPIIVGYARRSGDQARYEIGVTRIIHPAEWEAQDDPLGWVTQAYTTAIETFVREDPEQYLWIHRRWKSQPRRPRRSVPSV